MPYIKMLANMGLVTVLSGTATCAQGLKDIVADAAAHHLVGRGAGRIS